MSVTLDVSSQELAPVAPSERIAILDILRGFGLFGVRRFRFGPAEWLWRSSSYSSAQPMRVRLPTVVVTSYV